MTVEDHKVIDIVSHHPDGDVVRLVMVEYREWGEQGGLLHDLQAKLNTYLAFVTEGQLASDYPELVGKRVRIELHSIHPLGERERRFLSIVESEYLKPEGIELGVTQLEKRGGIPGNQTTDPGRAE